MLRFQLALFPFLLGQALSIAQSQSLSFQHIDADKGLTAGYNWYMRHDSRGYLWISSLNGVFRFDGLSMKHYAPDNANGEGMKGANIQSDFFEDKEGNIWFSTNEAINKYIRKTDSFNAHYCKYNEDSLKTDYRIFYIEKDTLLWLSAGNRIFTYNIKTYESCYIIDTKGVIFSIDTTADGCLRQIFGCTSMNPDPFEIITIDKTGEICKEVFLQKGINDKKLDIQNALKQNDTLIWLFSNQGLLAFDPQAPNSVQSYKFPNYNNQKLLKGVFIDNETLLITSLQSGVWKFNIKNRVFKERLKYKKTVISEEMDNNPWGIYKDGYDQAWISQAANANVDNISLKPNRFTNPFLKAFPVLPNVNSIVEDLQGQIWCATKEHGIFVFSQEEKLLLHFPYNAVKGFINITQLSKDKAGIIWAVGRKGIFIFDSISNQWKKNIQVNNNNLLFLVHLSDTCKLLSSTNGMMELHIKNNNYLIKKSSAFAKEEGFTILQLFPGKDNIIYAPLEANKLILINQKGNKLLSKDTLLINTEVKTIWEEHNRPITWLGATNGLWRLDRQTGAFQNHELRKGELIVGQVWGVLGDKTGQLWIAADNGLWFYYPEKKITHFFGRVDELQVAPFSIFANIRASDGKIWLGTNEGLLVFDPATIHPFPQKIRVGIQSLKVNTIPYEKLQRVNIDELNNIKLPYYQNNFILGLVAITQYLPESSIIKYRLRGKDKDWTWIKNGETIHFFNLPAGKYELEMMAYNANNVPGKLRTLDIIIEPPFWQKWWFKASVIAIIATMLWGGIQLYVRRRLRQQQVIFERQQALQEERNRIAAELHDDMGAGLSTIRFLSSDLLQAYNNNIKIQQNIQSIYESSGTLFENMRDIIWATNVENDTLESLLFYIQSYAYNFLNTNQIHCEFRLPDTIPSTEVSGSWRRNILLAVKETLHNAVKHAQATKVIIQITIEEQLLHIRIQDNGIGLQENNITKS